ASSRPEAGAISGHWLVISLPPSSVHVPGASALASFATSDKDASQGGSAASSGDTGRAGTVASAPLTTSADAASTNSPDQVAVLSGLPGSAAVRVNSPLSSASPIPARARMIVVAATQSTLRRGIGVPPP